MDLSLSVARLEHLAQILTAASCVERGGGLRDKCSCCKEPRSECRFIAGSLGLAVTDGETQQEGLTMAKTIRRRATPKYHAHTGMAALCQYYHIDPEQCRHIFDRSGYVGEPRTLTSVILHVRDIQEEQLHRIHSMGSRLFKHRRGNVYPDPEVGSLHTCGGNRRRSDKKEDKL